MGAKEVNLIATQSLSDGDEEEACDFTFSDDFVSNEEEVIIGQVRDSIELLYLKVHMKIYPNEQGQVMDGTSSDLLAY